MESIGDKLRGAREEKGYSLDQVARDTNIARRFIEAMEQEDFTVFPGDTYVLGFLRNYADYLGLDPEKVITLYKNLKIQEQPVPVQELIHRKRSIPPGLILLVVLALGVLGGGGYGLFSYLRNRPAEPERNMAGEETASAEQEEQEEPDYLLREEIVEKRFAEGDRIRIFFSETNADVRVGAIGETVAFDLGDTDLEVALGRERKVDLDGDGRNDIKISVHDIDAEESTTVLRFDRSLFDASGEVAQGDRAAGQSGDGTSIGSTSAESREQEAEVILTAEEREAFRLSVNFRGYCLLRYLKDDSMREERYFHRGETFRLDVSEEVMLWISNAGSFNARVAGEEVSFGGPGEVSTRLIRWEENGETGSCQLKLIPVY